VWSTSRFSKPALAACLIAVAGTVLLAVERMPLPAFSLTRGDGSTIASAALVRPGAWALIYVAPRCVPCAAVLRSLDRAAHPTLAPRLVVIVGGATPDDLREEAALYPDLSDATWLADPASVIPQPIGEAGVPAIIGLRGATIEWGLTGVLTDPADAKSILVNWLAQ
jgi:hypothetical protein